MDWCRRSAEEGPEGTVEGAAEGAAEALSGKVREVERALEETLGRVGLGATVRPGLHMQTFERAHRRASPKRRRSCRRASSLRGGRSGSSLSNPRISWRQDYGKLAGSPTSTPSSTSCERRLARSPLISKRSTTVCNTLRAGPTFQKRLCIGPA